MRARCERWTKLSRWFSPSAEDNGPSPRRSVARVGSRGCPAHCSRPTSATSGSSPRSRRRSPSSTSTRCGRTPTRCWSGPAGKPIRVASKSVRCRALLEADPRPRRALPRADDLHPAGDAVARRAGLRGPAARLPDRRRRGARGAGAALGRQPGRGADRDGRLRRAPRPDRVGARGAGRRRSGSASTSTPAGGRSAGGSRSAPKRSPVHTRRAGGGAGAGDRAAGRRSNWTR